MPTNSKTRPVPRDLTRAEWGELLNSVSEKAVQEAREMGLTITIAKDGKIYRSAYHTISPAKIYYIQKNVLI